MADWDDVRAIATGFPDVEESTQGRPAYRVRGKLFAWKSRDRDGAQLAIRVEREEKPLILDSDPEIYFETQHYVGYPGVLVRLEAIGREELAERLEDAWLIQAPKRLASEYLSASAKRR
jgi:hypothetical protein